MRSDLKQIIGKKYNRLTIKGFSNKRTNSGGMIAICECDCGNKYIGNLADIKANKTKSCGCLKREKLILKNKQRKTHGYRHHPLYDVYRGMMRRCYDPKIKSYKNYGGRGITVCKRWHNVENFIKDVKGIWIKGLEIDRIDNNSGYEPGNVRFVTRSENMRNTRANKYVTVKGKRVLLTDASNITGIPISTLSYRLSHNLQNKY